MEGQESRSSPGGDCLDEVFAALGHRLRRRVLLRLLDRPSTSIDDLLPAHEGNEHRDRVEVQLHHAHLPTLDDADFVDWDGERRISRGSKYGAVEPVLELLADHRDRLPGEWP